MGFWSSIATGVKTIVSGAGNNILKPIGRSAADTVAHPTATVGNIAKATKAAALPAAGGYLAWENIANDKSVVESVKDVVVGEDKSVVEVASDIAIGEKNTERIAGVIDSVAGVADKANETLDTVNGAAASMGVGNGGTGSGGGLDGISSFFKSISSGDGLLGTIGNLFGNIFKGNVSGMSMVGLVAAAFLTFGRFGWLGRIAGALMGMMLIGNNSKSVTPVVSEGRKTVVAEQQQEEEQRQRHVIRR